MKLFLYSPATSRFGNLAGEDLLPESESVDYPCSDSPEVFLWGSGERHELLWKAYFEERCARAVLHWIHLERGLRGWFD